MGGQQSQESQRFLQHFQQQYQMIKDFNDPRFGEVQIYKNKSGQDQIMLKTYWSSNESDFKHCVSKCERRTQVEHRNLIRLLGYHTNASNQLCGDFTKVSIYFQYFEHTLERLIEQRYARQQFYAETELWNLFEQIVSVCLVLSANNQYVGDIRPCNIMVDQENVLKLAEHGLVQGDKTGFQRAYYNQEKAYLAPEFLPFIQEQLPNNPPVTQKSEIFALGLTMLECSTLISAKSLYTFSRVGMQFNYHMLNQMLEQVMQLGYSSTWYRMIREMLKERPEERPSFNDIDSVLSPFRAQIQRFQPFSIEGNPKPQDNYQAHQAPQTPPVQYQQQINASAYMPPQQTIQAVYQPLPQQQQAYTHQSMIKSLPQQQVVQYGTYGMNQTQPLYIPQSPQREEVPHLPLNFTTQPIQDIPSDYRNYIAASPQKPIGQIGRQPVYYPQQVSQYQPEPSIDRYAPQYEPPLYQQQQYQPQSQVPSIQHQQPDPGHDVGLSELDMRIQKALKSSQDTANRHYQTPSYY